VLPTHTLARTDTSLAKLPILFPEMTRQRVRDERLRGHLSNSIVFLPESKKGRVAQISVIEMNLGAPRAVSARGVFDFGFAGKLNRVTSPNQAPVFRGTGN
jgi:hypothetical protein